VAASRRQPRMDALLRSWKLAHRQMKERGDPDADMIAADIESLENGRPVAEYDGARVREDQHPADPASLVTRSRS
jgi:hypothetical protein